MLLLMLVVGCGADWEVGDQDGDGLSILDGDCDDTDPEVGADVNSLWYADADADGFGDPGVYVFGCEAPEGYVANGFDCDDTDDTVSPAEEEDTPGDGVDTDCDGED